MKKMLLQILIVAAMLLTPQRHLSAQSFKIDWFTVDAGGGISTGGVYAVSGTIGQADTGGMSGGNFSLVGGFWSVIQTQVVPLLTAVRNAITGVLTISWPRPADGFLLEQASALSGTPIPWTQMNPPYQTNTTHVFITVPSPSGSRYYRLRKP